MSFPGYGRKKSTAQLAEIAGFIRVAGSIGLAGGGKFNIILTSEGPAVIRHYKALIREYFNVDTTLSVGEAISVGKNLLQHNHRSGQQE